MPELATSKYQLAMFDLDGTLADTLPWMRSVFNELAEEFGFRKVQAHEYDHFKNMHGTALLRELKLPLWKLPRVVAAMRRKMSAQINTFHLYPGIGDVLEQLNEAGIQLAVVSTNSRENVERLLGPQHAGLISHFGCGASMFGKAARLRQTVRASGAKPSRAIYIGDEVRDAEAARAAAVDFGAALWGQHDEPTLRAENPALVFSAVADIARLLTTG